MRHPPSNLAGSLRPFRTTLSTASRNAFDTSNEPTARSVRVAHGQLAFLLPSPHRDAAIAETLALLALPADRILVLPTQQVCADAP